MEDILNISPVTDGINTNSFNIVTGAINLAVVFNPNCSRSLSLIGGLTTFPSITVSDGCFGIFPFGSMSHVTFKDKSLYSEY